MVILKRKKINLIFDRWGKIRMLLPYQPDYKQDQLKVPGTCAAGTCNGQHSHQVTTSMTVNVDIIVFSLLFTLDFHYLSSYLINYFAFQMQNLFSPVDWLWVTCLGEFFFSNSC